MGLESGNYIDLNMKKDLKNSLNNISKRNINIRGVKVEKNIKYNLDNNLNPELSDFLSDDKLDGEEISALKEIFEKNKTGILIVSKENLKKLRNVIASTKKQNYIGDSEKNKIVNIEQNNNNEEYQQNIINSDNETPQQVITNNNTRPLRNLIPLNNTNFDTTTITNNSEQNNKINEAEILKLLKSFHPNDIVETFLKVKKLDNLIYSTGNISIELKEHLIGFFEKLVYILKYENEKIGKYNLDVLISGVRDLWNDLFNNKSIFNIDNKDFQEELSKITIEGERIRGEELHKKHNNEFLLSIEQLNGSINKNTKVILVGINEYQNVSHLRGAINDINKVKETIIKLYGVPAQNIILVKNEHATKTNILQKINMVSTQSTGSTLVYYSGHGTHTKNKLGFQRGTTVTDGKDEKQSYIVPVNGKSGDKNTLISAKELSSALEGKGLVITDMCESGDFVNNLDSDINGISAADETFAAEITNKKMGVFTYFFTEALIKYDGKISEALKYTTGETELQSEVIKVNGNKINSDFN